MTFKYLKLSYFNNALILAILVSDRKTAKYVTV